MPSSTRRRASVVPSNSSRDNLSGEDDFIARHFASWAGAAGLSLRDDAALLTPPAGHDLVITADAVVAGVHFLPDDPPEDIARKALRVNLSDLAAKGAQPLGFLLTLALPAAFSSDAVAAFATGLRDDAAAYACPLIGGDTVSTPGPLTVAITALGVVPTGRMVRRDGARAGDAIYVSGTIGDAALGLLALRRDPRLSRLSEGDRAWLIDRYRRPQPRAKLAPALLQHVSAAMDVSDGIMGDLDKMLTLAGLALYANLIDVPISPAAMPLRTQEALAEVILTGGDDYEIICAVPPEQKNAFERMAAEAEVPVALLGFAIPRTQTVAIFFADGNGRAIVPGRLSFSHV